MSTIEDLQAELASSLDREAVLTQELAAIKAERAGTKAVEEESLSKIKQEMRHENAGLMSEAVRTTQLLSTLQEDIVLHRENLTTAQMKALELYRVGEEKDQINARLTDKVDFLQTAIETLNDEKISLVDESVAHVDALHKMEGEYFKKKEELEDVKKRLSKQVEEDVRLKEEVERLAASSDLELLASLEATIAADKKENERMKQKMSELKKTMKNDELLAAALREDLRLKATELEAVKAEGEEAGGGMAELSKDLSKLKIQYIQKKDAVIALTKENAALKHGGAIDSGAGDEISKLIDEREELLDLIAALEASVEEQNAHLSDAANDVDFLEKKVQQTEHQIEKMTQYRTQNKEMNAELIHLRNENNELVKQTAHLQRTKDIKNNTFGGPPVFGKANRVPTNQSLGSSEFADPMGPSVSGISPGSPFSSRTMGSVPCLSPKRESGGLSSGSTNKKLKVTQDKLMEERLERKAAIELLKLVLTELDQNSARGEDPAESKPSAGLLTAQWMQMNGRNAGSHDIGYHDGDSSVGLSVMEEDDDGSVDLRARLSKGSGDVEALGATEAAAFVLATEGLEHLMLGWHTLKVPYRTCPVLPCPSV
jgi:hypothetical protein